ncbi:MAG: hypothetical protein FWG13_05975 [Leptospirales bacterium]|nr:hypothetical protein [Leptospirales bacterium]
MKKLILLGAICGLLNSCETAKDETLTYTDGTVYVGQVKNGVPNGQGTYTWPDGKKYVGQWKDDKYHGQGTYTWPDGRKYVGQFKDGKRDGNGTMTYSRGGVVKYYAGQWKDDKYHGQGTETYMDDSKYVGKWKDGGQDEGVIYTKDGEVDGIVQNGNWISPKRDTEMYKKETYTLPDCSKFENNINEYIKCMSERSRIWAEKAKALNSEIDERLGQ